MTARSLRACRCNELGEQCPACEARIEAAQDRDPILDRDWDALETGPLWHTYPGMGAA